MTTYSKDTLDILVHIYNELRDNQDSNLQDFIYYYDTFLALAWGVSMDLCEPSAQLRDDFVDCYDSFVRLVGGDISEYLNNPHDFAFMPFQKPQGVVYV